MVRPAANEQSALRAPLNRILGTEVNVRILRVLAEASAPLGRAEVARRAEANASGVRRALGRLVELGIVEPVGTGSRRPVQLRREHPLAPALESLFAAERGRFQDLLDRLRSAVGHVHPPPRAAWIEGSLAAGTDRPGDPVVVGFLAAADEVDALSEQLQARLTDVMRRHDVRVDVRAYTAADIHALGTGKRAALARAPLLSGPPPLALVEEAAPRKTGRSPKSHAELDRRGLALASAVAERLAADPSILDRARAHIARRMEEASPGERKELVEWERLLGSLSIAQIRKLLVDPGERATRLRQSLPFLDVLSQEEREEIRGRGGG